MGRLLLGKSRLLHGTVRQLLVAPDHLQNRIQLRNTGPVITSSHSTSVPRILAIIVLSGSASFMVMRYRVLMF